MNIPVAERWFERKELGEITLVIEPHVHPILRANIWHIRGRDRDLLVDSGLGICSLREFAPDLFDRPVVAVASHSHYDHFGGLHEFETRAAHGLDAEAIRRPDFGSLLVSDFPPEYHDEFGDDDELITAYPSPDFDAARYNVRPAEPTWLVEDGEIIDLGDRQFVVLHLPGHTPGSIALWDAETGVLFPGDVVYDGVLLDGLPESDITDYVASMERLRSLPVRVVHPGHHGSFGRERYVQLIDGYLQGRG